MEDRQPATAWDRQRVHIRLEFEGEVLRVHGDSAQLDVSDVVRKGDMMRAQVGLGTLSGTLTVVFGPWIIERIQEVEAVVPHLAEHLLSVNDDWLEWVTELATIDPVAAAPILFNACAREVEEEFAEVYTERDGEEYDGVSFGDPLPEMELNEEQWGKLLAGQFGGPEPDVALMLPGVLMALAAARALDRKGCMQGLQQAARAVLGVDHAQDEEGEDDD